MEGKNEFIKNILDELFVLDQDLRKYEKELVAAINMMIQNKPDTKFDKKFAQELKSQLLKKAEELKCRMPGDYWMEMFFGALRKLAYISAAAFFLSIVTLPIWSKYFLAKYADKGTKIADQRQLSDSFQAFKITKVPDSSFGALNVAPDAASQAPALGRGVGGGGGLTVTKESSDASAIMPPVEMANYRYIYKGEPLSEASDKMGVYKRIKPVTAPYPSSDILSQSSLGLANLNSFQNMGFKNLYFTENRDFGYEIFVNFEEGILEINQNWSKWNNEPTRACQDEKCLNENRLKITDIPDDNTLIALADQFVRDHGINPENYEPGQVDNAWREQYDRETDKANFWVPDQISVIYPLKVEGNTIYNTEGGKEGFRVNINIREKKVASLWGLTSQQYENALYEAETDTGKILSFAEKGGMYNMYNFEQAKTIEVEIGAPQLVYLKIWNYKNNQSDELLIPAYQFPVLKSPEDQPYFRKFITVPLVKEILDGQNQAGAPPAVLERSDQPVVPEKSVQ